MRFYLRPGQVLRKPCLIALKRLSVFRLKIAVWRYCDSSGLVVCSRMSFATVYDCFVSRGTSHIPVCLFLVPLLFVVHFFGLKFLACLV